MWPFEISFLLQTTPLRSILLIACLNNLFLCWVDISDRCMVFLHVSHWKSRCRRGCTASVVSKGIVPCFFQLLVFTGIPWLQSLSPCSNGLLLCVSHLYVLWGHWSLILGSIRVIQDDLISKSLITFAKIVFPHKVSLRESVKHMSMETIVQYPEKGSSIDTSGSKAAP